MNDSQRTRLQLECLYDMFRDRVEENVIYIVYSENEGKIDLTIDQLMLIAKCSFTGYDFDARKPLSDGLINGSFEATNGTLPQAPSNSTSNYVRPTRGQPVTVQLQHPDSQHKQSHSANQQRNSPVDTAQQKTTDGLDNGDTESALDGDDEQGLNVDERIDKLQQSIEHLLMEKNTCHEKASQYLSKKMFPVTSYYSELASQYRRMIEAKTRKLVDLLLIKSQNANTIDLHGLNPLQAREVVKELLNIRLDKLSIDKQGEATIDIITGWGKHTINNNQHRIRPTVVAFLREKGFEFIFLNRGALRVTIRR